MSTKGDIAIRALKELRISGLTSAADGGEVESAIIRLDAMIASWQRYGLCAGYNKSAESVDSGQDSGLAQNEELAAILNLANSMAPSYGKSVHGVTLSHAKAAYDGLFDTSLTMRDKDPYQPTGAGSRRLNHTRQSNTFQSKTDADTTN